MLSTAAKTIQALEDKIDDWKRENATLRKQCQKLEWENRDLKHQASEVRIPMPVRDRASSLYASSVVLPEFAHPVSDRCRRGTSSTSPRRMPMTRRRLLASVHARRRHPSRVARQAASFRLFFLYPESKKSAENAS